jgi:hypothetical protein
MRLLLKDDLRDLRIVSNWNTLNKWIDERGFPPGRIIGRNRVWTESEVFAWIEAQPPNKSTKGFAKKFANGEDI